MALTFGGSGYLSFGWRDWDIEQSRHAFSCEHHATAIGDAHRVQVAPAADRFGMADVDVVAAREFKLEFRKWMTPAKRA